MKKVIGLSGFGSSHIIKYNLNHSSIRNKDLSIQSHKVLANIFQSQTTDHSLRHRQYH